MESMNTAPMDPQFVSENHSEVNVLSSHPTEGLKEVADIRQMSCAEIVENVAILLQQEELPARSEVARFEKVFFSKKNRYAEGTTEEDRRLLEDAEIQEIRFKDLINAFKEKNQKRIEAENILREQNTQDRKELLESFKSLLESSEDFLRMRARFSEITEQWKAIGPATEAEQSKLQKEYSHCVEQFYDLKQINDEFREYDFKKNLDAKKELIERTRLLLEEPDTVKATRELQDIHRLWKDLGPVAPDLRDSIWAEFKELSSTINKKNQEYFDGKKSEQEENLQQKRRLCEEVESIPCLEFTQSKQWGDASDKVQQLQAQWKEVGYVPRKENDAIYTRFRAACDAFFSQKATFFSKLRQQREDAVTILKEYIEEAESLKESTEWKAASDRIKTLQKKWKEVLYIPGKRGDELRKQFSEVCDYFFQRYKEHNANAVSGYAENLRKKKQIIQECEQLFATEEIPSDFRSKILSLIEQFNKVGHVPMKDKNKINSKFHSLIDRLFERLNSERSRSSLQKFEQDLEKLDEKSLLRQERERLQKAFQRTQKELLTYVNNMGFLNKFQEDSNNPLLKNAENMKNKLERNLELLSQKIERINEKLNQ